MLKLHNPSSTFLQSDNKSFYICGVDAFSSEEVLRH